MNVHENVRCFVTVTFTSTNTWLLPRLFGKYSYFLEWCQIRYTSEITKASWGEWSLSRWSVRRSGG